MRKPRFKTIKLFFKLVLVFQIYAHHTFPAEANDAAKSFKENKVGDVTGMKTGETVLNRPKKPARLLPLRMILGKEKNKTEIENAAKSKIFYGPATSCEELLKIGYTRNGFYLVKGNATSDNSHVVIVDCLFKRPDGVKEVKEKRLGPIPLKIKKTKLHKRRSSEAILNSMMESDENNLKRLKRPIRLLPLHIIYGNEKNDIEEENVDKPFYGPPGNCVDLAKLGYTLNGYYLVNGSKISSKIEVVLCRFQLPSEVKEIASEERLGFIDLDQLKSSNKEFKATLERNIRPVRLLPPRRQIEKGENKTAQQNVQRVNSNPANCNDVGMLGHTLNGYYIVNSSESVGRFGVIFCQYKLPPGADRTTKEDKYGFINLLENINETSIGTIIKHSNNCKDPAILIVDIRKFGNRCMVTVGMEPRFESCNSSKTRQHWRIQKMGNDGKYIRICQRRVDNGGNTSIATHDCLTALSQIQKDRNRNVTIRSIKLRPQMVEGDASQKWQENGTTHQFASVQYPTVCITMMPTIDALTKISTYMLLLKECNGNGYESSNPHLTNKYYQSFYPKPTPLEKNSETQCYD